MAKKVNAIETKFC